MTDVQRAHARSRLTRKQWRWQVSNVDAVLSTVQNLWLTLQQCGGEAIARVALEMACNPGTRNVLVVIPSEEEKALFAQEIEQVSDQLMSQLAIPRDANDARRTNGNTEDDERDMEVAFLKVTIASLTEKEAEYQNAMKAADATNSGLRKWALSLEKEKFCWLRGEVFDNGEAVGAIGTPDTSPVLPTPSILSSNIMMLTPNQTPRRTGSFVVSSDLGVCTQAEQDSSAFGQEYTTERHPGDGMEQVSPEHGQTLESIDAQGQDVYHLEGSYDMKTQFEEDTFVEDIKSMVSEPLDQNIAAHCQLCGAPHSRDPSFSVRNVPANDQKLSPRRLRAKLSMCPRRNVACVSRDSQVTSIGNQHARDTWRSTNYSLSSPRNSAEFGYETLRQPSLLSDASIPNRWDSPLAHHGRDTIARMPSQSQRVQVLEAEQEIWRKEELVLRQKLADFHAYIYDFRRQVKRFQPRKYASLENKSEDFWESIFEGVTSAWDRLYADCGQRASRLEKKQQVCPGWELHCLPLFQSNHGVAAKHLTKRGTRDAAALNQCASEYMFVSGSTVKHDRISCADSPRRRSVMSLPNAKMSPNVSSPSGKMYRNVATPQKRCTLEPVHKTLDGMYLQFPEIKRSDMEMDRRRSVKHTKRSGAVPDSLPAINC